MPRSKMMKLNLIMIRDQSDDVISALISLGTIEVAEPDDFSDNAALEAAVTRELFPISHLNAGVESIPLLGTQYTYALTGWLPVRSTHQVNTALSSFICAWEIIEPTPEDSINAPKILSCPGLFGKLRLGKRRQFSPLCRQTERRTDTDEQHQ